MAFKKALFIAAMIMVSSLTSTVEALETASSETTGITASESELSLSEGSTDTGQEVLETAEASEQKSSTEVTQ